MKETKWVENRTQDLHDGVGPLSLCFEPCLMHDVRCAAYDGADAHDSTYDYQSDLSVGRVPLGSTLRCGPSQNIPPSTFDSRPCDSAFLFELMMKAMMKPPPTTPAAMR